MGFRFRKSIKIAPGVKMNLTKRGVGTTIGTRGAHLSVHSSGKKTTSVGVPGSGFSYVSSTSTHSRKNEASDNSDTQVQIGDTFYDLGASLAPFVNYAAADLVEFILVEDQKQSPDRQAYLGKNARVLRELLSLANALYYFKLDAWALANLTQKDYLRFSDGATAEVVDALAKSWDQPEKARPTVTRVLKEDIAKLAPYAAHPIPKPSENPKGTLYWEFGKLLTADFGVDPVLAVRANTTAMKVDMDLVAKINSILAKSNTPTL